MLEKISIFLWVNLWWEEMERRLIRLGFRRVSRIEFGFVKWEWETRDCETYLLISPLFSCFSVISVMKEWESFSVCNKVSSNKMKLQLQKLSRCWLRLSLFLSLMASQSRRKTLRTWAWRMEVSLEESKCRKRKLKTKKALESSRSFCILSPLLTYVQTFSMGKSTGSPCQS